MIAPGSGGNSPTKTKKEMMHEQSRVQATSAGLSDMAADYGAISNQLGASIGDNIFREYEREIKRQDFANTSLGAAGADIIIDAVTGPNAGIDGLAFNDYTRHSNESWSSIPMTSKNPASPPKAPQRPSPPNDEANNNELNIIGLNNILDFIESHLKLVNYPENFYKESTSLNKALKANIIKLAKEGRSLNGIDPVNASTVVRECLPMLVYNFASKQALLTPDLLVLDASMINEKLIASYLTDANDRLLWMRLVKHWKTLKRQKILDETAIARIFGPAVAGPNLKSMDKVFKFIERVLSPEEPRSESKSLTETSLNHELMLASSSKLKETASYQKFITSSKSNVTANKMTANSDSDEDSEDIDRMALPKTQKSIDLSSSNKINQPAKPSNTSIMAPSIINSPRNANDFEYSLSLLSSVRSSRDKLPGKFSIY